MLATFWRGPRFVHAFLGFALLLNFVRWRKTPWEQED